MTLNGLHPPRRVTVLQNTKFKNVMRFKYHPVMVRIDNESKFEIHACDYELMPDTISRDDTTHDIRIAPRASAIVPMKFERNELWMYSPNGDAVIKVSYTDSTDILDLLKLITGIPGSDILHNIVSDINSTTAKLVAGATFTGDWVDVLDYVQAGVLVRADQTGTLYLDYSSDGTNTDKTFTINITDTTAGTYVSFTPRARYLRIRYTNGATAQGTFRLQTLLSQFAKGFYFLPLGDTSLTDAAITLLCKSVIVGRNYSGTYDTVPVDNGKRLRVNSQDYLFCIAEGDVPDHDDFGKIGFITGLTGVTELTITPQGGNYVFPASAMQMSIKSSDNTDDKAGGAGALTVLINYLNASYEEKTETLVLTGTTWADTVATDIFRVNSMVVATAGANGKPTGAITLADKATRAINFGYFEAGRNRMRQAVFTVPTGKSLYITTINWGVVTTAANKYGRITMLANYDDRNHTILAKGLYIALAEATLTQSSSPINYAMPIKIPATVDIKFNGISDGTATINVAFRGWLEA